MICGFKIQKNGRELACGRCMACRINKKRMWTGRIMLEQKESHYPGTFLTLTYDDDHLPEDKSLHPEHLKAYINRLRHSSLGHFRYFAVGEYGDKTQRPHYHLAIFNARHCHWGEQMDKSWKMGFTKAGELTTASAAYIAGYCTKKMTSHDDERLDGRYPEFARMSKRPPLGAQGVRRIADLLTSRHGSAMLEKKRDVPFSFRYEGKVYPLGRYWIDYLRDYVGVNNVIPTGEGWDVPLYGEITTAEKRLNQRQARACSDKAFRQSKRNTTRKL